MISLITLTVSLIRRRRRKRHVAQWLIVKIISFFLFIYYVFENWRYNALLFRLLCLQYIKYWWLCSRLKRCWRLQSLCCVCCVPPAAAAVAADCYSWRVKIWLTSTVCVCVCWIKIDYLLKVRTHNFRSGSCMLCIYRVVELFIFFGGWRKEWKRDARV